MSYKFDSLVMILNKLDKCEHVTVQSLMRDLEVCERSVHRYLSSLQVAGFPILYDRTRQTYAFEGGYGLRKLALSPEETLAFALAKKMLGNTNSALEEVLCGIETRLAREKADLPKHKKHDRSEKALFRTPRLPLENAGIGLAQGSPPCLCARHEL